MFVKNIRLSLTDKRGIMCGAYGFSIQDAKDVYAGFDVVNQLDDLQARYNLRPGQLNPVITRHSPNRMSRMFWGGNPALGEG
jgi:putative SOS response-associated peptidase YedK